jgi:hypothetical protein
MISPAQRMLLRMDSALLCAFSVSLSCAEQISSARGEGIWARDNLVAWEAAPYDSKKRSPEQRAQLFERSVIKHYAYLASANRWNDKDEVNISQFEGDGEIEAMQRHGIDIPAWHFWVNADRPDEDASARRAVGGKNQSIRRVGGTSSPSITIRRPKSANRWARVAYANEY